MQGILDVRDAPDTALLARSVRIPWRELRTGDRLCELPPKGAELFLIHSGTDVDRKTADAAGDAVPWRERSDESWAIRFLRAHGYSVVDSFNALDVRERRARRKEEDCADEALETDKLSDADDQHAEAGHNALQRWAEINEKWQGGGVVDFTGDAADDNLCEAMQKNVLWNPNAFLESSINMIEAAVDAARSQVDFAEQPRTALDLACGSARDGIWLALRKWNVHAVDLDDALLEIGAGLAHRLGCSQFTTEKIDLENDAPALDTFLAGRRESFFLVHVARYLHRELFPTIRELVSPGGIVAYHTFMKGVEAFGKPRRPRFILQPGELKSHFEGWTVLRYDETTLDDGRPVQFIVAQKPISTEVA